MKIKEDTIDIRPESGFDLDSVLFFDIETTGLSRENSFIYLIGCAFQKDDEWVIRQYLAKNREDEENIIRDFYELADRYQTLIHFNGDGFDVPFTDFRASYHGIDERLSDKKNFDIFKRAKAAKKFLGLSSMSQKAVEAFLKIRRDDEMNGGQLISYYHEYAKSGDESLEKFLLLHNHDDVLGMIKISPVVNFADILDGRFHVTGTEQNDDTFTINIKLDSAVPVPFEKEDADHIIAMNDDFMQVVIKTYKGVAHYRLNDHKNYYYLPAEDKVIHKDVALFVDKEHRIKANRNNCIIKKESIFLPQKKDRITPCFFLPGNEKKKCFELEKALAFGEEELYGYALEIICG